jgi:hypothetical protein
MPRRLAAVIAATVLLLLGAAPTASAAPLPTDSGVWLDPTAPVEGERVSGIRTVQGRAQLPEGITRVELHVVPTGSTAEMTPVASAASTVLGIGEVDFTFEWDTTRTPGVVDVRVVAVGLLRSVEAVVPGVVVVAPRARIAPPPRQTVVQVSRKPARSVSRRAPVRAPDRSAGVYLGGYGALDYGSTPPVTGAVTRAAASTRPIDAPPPAGPWRSLAAGLLVLLTAAHVHRMLRTPPPLEGPS